MTGNGKQPLRGPENAAEENGAQETGVQSCNTLLLVDDMRINRTVLRALFEGEYEILEAEDGAQAMALLRREQARIAAVLLDLLMPVKDGYAVLQEAAADEALSRIPIVVITADHTPESEVRALDLGATDIITKPFESRSVKRRIKNAVELYVHKRYLEELVQEQASQIRESSAALLDGLSSIIEHRSLESGQHIRRIRSFTRILLEEVAREHPEYEMNEQTIELISSASSLHDIGKIAIPDAVLNKPGRLTPEEFEIMKTHTLRGCDILMGLGQIQEPEYMGYAYNICRYHHERWDGRGYPDGLQGNNIPIYAQVVSVADCFDALTTDRVYKKAIPLNEACDMIRRGECGSFSPELLACFDRVLPAFFELSRRYADGGLSAAASAETPDRRPSPALRETLPARSRDKLLALLRYLDATVLEVDWNAGTCHLLYQADHNFSVFRGQTAPAEADRVFIERCVHPKDRARAAGLLGVLSGGFFREGTRELSDSYRVADAGGGYARYRCAILRLGSEDDPRSCRALIVWRRMDGDGAEQPEPALWPMDTRSGVAALLRENDREMTVTAANRAFAALTGYSADALKTRFHDHFAELLDPADRDRVFSQMQRQMAVGRDLRLEYRISAADGRTVWVLENSVLRRRSGGEYLQCALTDVTTQKRVQEELRQDLERYRTAVQQESGVVFEWDVATDRLWFSGNWELRFGYPAESLLGRELESGGHIYPADVENIRRTLRAIRGGSLREETEFRVLTAGGQYRWQRARMTVQMGGGGRPGRVVGLLSDVEDGRWPWGELPGGGSRDRLTGLYQSDAAQKQIAYCLSQLDEDSIPAVLLLNVDGFHHLNRRYGSLFGDAVLEELARALRRTFRRADVIARMGGDEFLIFLPSVSSAAVAGERAGRLLEACRRVMRSAGELTCRVGVALDWRRERSCDALLRDCGRALARAKSRGGDGYVIFSDETADAEPPELPASPEIEPGEDMASALSRIVSDTLGGCGADPEQAVAQALERIGRLLSVSRVYIYEALDGGRCRASLAWNAEETAPLAGGWPEQSGAHIPGEFDERGMLRFWDPAAEPPERREWMERNGTLSSLWCAVTEADRFLGFVGFDDCALRRIWRREQEETLAFAAKLLFSILNGGSCEPQDPAGGPRA